MAPNNYISCVNELQDELSNSLTDKDLNIGLPQIVVVGNQSEGKSSVLDSLTGKELLPKGEGIVTRTPIILQLVHGDEEYGEIRYNSGKVERFNDSSKIRDEIAKETKNVAGDNKGISKTPIRLKYVSPNVLDLTVVDLPGMTKIPVGNQPKNIERLVRELIEEYIENENTLICAVTSASADLTTSDGMQLALKHDPDGERTIGVITKLDCTGNDTTGPLNVLEGRTLPLKHGYVGVVNRSKEDTKQGMTIEEAQDREAKFFRKHPAYKHLKDRMGSRYLQQKLHQVLDRHIRNKLPGIRTALMRKISQLEDQVEDSGYSENVDKSKQLYTLLELLGSDLETQIEGGSMNVNVKTFRAGARILNAMNEDIYQLFVDAKSKANDKEIAMALANLNAIRNPLFPDQRAFDLTVQELTENYKTPAKSGISIIKSLLVSAIEKAAKDFLETYPKLQSEVVFLINRNLDQCEKQTWNHLEALVEAEKSFMNTRHPAFVKEDLKFWPKNEGTLDSVDRLLSSPLLGSFVPSGVSASVKAGKKVVNGLKKQPSSNDDNISDDEDDEFDETIGFKGKLTLRSYEGDGDVYVVLEQTMIKVFDNEMDFTNSGKSTNIKVGDVTLSSSYDRDGKAFTLKHKTGETLIHHESPKAVLIATSKVDEWTEAFNAIFDDPDSNAGQDAQHQKSIKKMDQSKVLAAPFFREHTDLTHDMVKKYMEIVHVTISDMAPKFMIMSLVKAVIRYIKQELLGELLHERKSEEDIKKLMETGPEEKKRMEKLTTDLQSVRNALEVVKQLSEEAFDFETISQGTNDDQNDNDQ